MHYDLGVAHLARAAGCTCPWPLPTYTGSTEIAAIFAHLPSLALEEVFWHHLIGEALDAAAAALADEKNEDDDVTDVGVLCAWLASVYTPLRSSPEFCRVVRRLSAAWPGIADAHFGARGLAWRGVSSAPRPGRGSVTCVEGGRGVGKTTAAVRLGRVLARRVKHAVCVVANGGDLDQVFVGLGIAEYEAAHTDDNRGFDATNVGRMWEAVGPLVRAYARESVLVLVDDLHWDTEQGALLIDEITNLGVHLVVTSQRTTRHWGICPDRLVWMLGFKTPWALHGATSFSCITGIDRDRIVAAYDAHMRGDTTRFPRVTLVGQRRRDDTWDLQVMPYRASLATAPPV